MYEDEYHISDCSSSCSETENVERPTRSCSYTHKRRRVQPKPESIVRRKQLPIKRRKSSTNSARNILSTLNTNETQSPTLTAQTTESKSTFLKVRNVFAPVSSSKSNECLQNVLTTQLANWQTTAKDNDDTIIDDCSSSDTESIPSCSLECAPSIESATTTSQKSSTAPTELDMLLALIERENSTPTQKPHRRKPKRCCKDGYLHHLQRLLEAARTDRKFLEHDKKFGCQNGTEFEVMQLEASFGVQTAIVRKTETDIQRSRFVLDADLALRVKVGSKLEAFFDVNYEPYTEVLGGERQDNVYVQPYKLLLL